MTDKSSSGGTQRASGESTPISAGSLTSREYIALVDTSHIGAAVVTQTTSVANDEDDPSDVSMTEDSDDDSDRASSTAPIIITQRSPLPGNISNSTPEPSKKRKLTSDEANTMDKDSWQTEKPQDHKRTKTSEQRIPIDRSQLPAEIWHHIFTFTTPRALGRLLQLNKTFRGYLDSSYPDFPSPFPRFYPLLEGVLRSQSSEAIWQAARRMHHPGMPSPLKDHTELDMWKLACTSRCQFCDRTWQPISPIMDKWHPGPGENGVSPIWPFAVRSCGSCLKSNSITDRKVMVSPLSIFIPGMPFVFVTSDLHVLPVMQISEPLPQGLELGKFFFKPHMEAFKAEWENVQGMGSGTAEEWLKGLEDVGKERCDDAARWERWSASSGIQRMRARETVEVPKQFQRETSLASGMPQAHTIARPQPLAIPPKLEAATKVYRQPTPGTFSRQSIQATGASFSNLTPPHRFDSPSQNGFLSYPPERTFMQTRHERTKEEVADLKAARRAEIERRSMLIQNPITPAVLSHMSSFQAAIQIIQPMDDNQWKILMPRLLSQRGDAEQRENDRVTQTRLIQETYEQRQQHDIQTKEAREFVDKEWEDTQTPVRTRIGGYADEIIRDGWDGGAKVNKETSPSFAADVLIYVRKRFYAEIAKNDAAARAAGQHPKDNPPNGPFTQKLILENMKWVFDVKIKPHTEQYRKELFLCNGCDGMNFKFYGFEGVIQHYAAKHTSGLSLGSIVVHWRAEWPEIPPFHPDPASGKSSFYVPPVSAATYPSGAASLPQAFGYGGYPSTSGQAPPPILAQQHPAGYQQSPGPFYGHPQFGDQYQRTQAGPFAPPPGFQGQPQAYSSSNYHASQPNGYQPYQGQGYPLQAFDGSYPISAPHTFESPHPSQVFPVSMAEMGSLIYQPVTFPATGQFNPGSYNAGTIAAGINRTEEYQIQLQDIARNARDLWNNTAGVKEMLGSVRVYVILYHLLQRSRAKFSEDPPLTMLIDGFSNNRDMRPVRNVNGLACRACILEKAQGISHSKPQGITEKKFLSLPQLLNHFQAVHIGDMHPPSFDWTKDMVELPDNAKIAALAFAQGMDEYKLQLITEALPGAFRVPAAIAESSVENLPPSRDEHLNYYGKLNHSRASDTINDEYDDYHAAPIRQETPVLVTSSRRRQYDDIRMNHHEQAPITYIERRAVSPMGQVRVVDDQSRRAIRDDGRVYLESIHHRRDTDVRGHGPRESEMVVLDDVPRNERGYRADVPLARLLEERNLAAANPVPRIQEVVVVQARVDQRLRAYSPSRPVSVSGPSQRSQQPSRAERTKGGSEESEVRAHQTPDVEARNHPLSLDAESAAETFLNGFQPSGIADGYAKKAEEAERRNEEALRSRWEFERSQSMRQMRQQEELPRSRDGTRHEDGRGASISRQRPIDERARSGISRLPPERQQRQHVVHDYEHRYVKSDRRSPEPVDQRYVVGNPVEREERPSSHSNNHPAGRYAQYETVRDDHERLGRSRSPVYVKLGPLPGQYREHSPTPRYVQQEPTYRTRTPVQPVEEVQYERVPRPEYYRVYADEPRPAPPRYEGHVEYVQVAGPQGDYVIRRPIRREPERVYTSYEEGSYVREPVSETRAPVSRSDPAYLEEYDPRNPAPPPSATVRQVRYQ